MSLPPHGTAAAAVPASAASIPMEVAFDAFMAEYKDPASPKDLVQTIIPPDLSPDDDDDMHNHDACSTAHESRTHGDQPQRRQSAAYNVDVVNAIRADDVPALRRMLASGQDFDVCNANGEYLLHLACRRSQPATVEFLIVEAAVRVDVRDGMGKTVLHDVCWKSTPDVALMATVLRLVPPELLLARDRRGHTPFDFARKQHSQHWNAFLQQYRDMIQERLFTHYFNKALRAEQQEQQQQQQQQEEELQASFQSMDC